MLKECRRVTEKDLVEVCRDILLLLDEALLPNAEHVEDKVFYLKVQLHAARRAQEGDGLRAVVLADEVTPPPPNVYPPPKMYTPPKKFVSGMQARGCGTQWQSKEQWCSEGGGMMLTADWNCRTLLHMHTRTCMCGALFDLRAAEICNPPKFIPQGLMFCQKVCTPFRHVQGNGTRTNPGYSFTTAPKVTHLKNEVIVGCLTLETLWATAAMSHAANTNQN